MTAPMTSLRGNTPDFESKGIERQRRRWATVDDVWEGTDALRYKGEVYLPRGPAEELPTYNRRLLRSRFYNIFRRAVKGLAGILLETPPTLPDDAPKELISDAYNIDGAGMALEVFARELTEQALRRGWGCVLVDAPKATTGNGRPLTQDEANAIGLRPYWVHIPAVAVRNFRTVVVGGVTIIDQFTYSEAFDKPVGGFEFEVEEHTRWRVLNWNAGRPGWRVYEAVRNGQPELVEEGTWEGFDRIPLSIFYAGDRKGVLDCDPPLWDLAETNLDHYIVQNEHRHCLHVASVPVMVFTGVSNKEDLIIAPDVGLTLPQDATAQYVEHSGKALGQTRDEIRDLEARAANQSLAMMNRETRAAETAEAKRLDKATQNAQIAVVGTGLKDCMEQSMVFHAKFRGIEAGDAPLVIVNTDFDEYLLEAGDIQGLSDMVAAEQLSLETLWQALHRAKRLPPDFDTETEAERIKNPIVPRPEPVALPTGPIGGDDEDDDEQRQAA